MEKVAILGGEASGKTVLLTVLSQLYKRRSPSGFWLEQCSIETAKFTQANWTTLTQHQDWPAATIPGTLDCLTWRLHHGNKTLDVEVHDYAGEIYRRAFVHNEAEGEPGDLRDRVSKASEVLLLINLRDIIDNPNSGRQIEDEWAPKAVLDFLAKNVASRVCIVFTQADRYAGILDSDELTEKSWSGVFKYYLPQLDETYPNIEVIAVSAVDDTEVVSDPQNPGLVLTRPAPEFTATGLEELLTWLVSQAAKAKRSRQAARGRKIAFAALVALIFFMAVGKARMEYHERVASERQAAAERAFGAKLSDATSAYNVFDKNGEYDSYLIACRMLPTGNVPEVYVQRYNELRALLAAETEWTMVPAGTTVRSVEVIISSEVASDGGGGLPDPVILVDGRKLKSFSDTRRAKVENLKLSYSQGVKVEFQLYDTDVLFDDPISFVSLTIDAGRLLGTDTSRPRTQAGSFDNVDWTFETIEHYVVYSTARLK